LLCAQATGANIANANGARYLKKQIPVIELTFTFILSSVMNITNRVYLFDAVAYPTFAPSTKTNPVNKEIPHFCRVTCGDSIDPVIGVVRAEFERYGGGLVSAEEIVVSRPNLLYVMTDQQRWDAMGCSGGWVETPALDRIAAEGVRFSNCVTNSPICEPARRSLATGLYPHNTGVWTNVTTTMPADTPTWMKALRDAGYRTSLFGKTHLHPHEGDLRDREHLVHAYGLDDVDEIGGPRASAIVGSHMTDAWREAGFLDAYRQDYRERFANKPHVVRPSVLPLDLYADVWVGQRAREYLEAYDRDEPWFCWVSFGGPHEPWDTPKPWADKYEPEDMPPPIPRPAEDQPRPKGTLDANLARPVLNPVFEEGEAQRMRADYAGNISLIDDQIGQILQAIEARGELDNTVIVFSSDHGEMNGDWGLIYKMNFLNGAVRIPLLVRTPETKGSTLAGTVHPSPAEWIDIGPTFADAAGVELGHYQFGRSLLPALDGSAHREMAVSEFAGECMILNDTWKMAVNRAGETYLLFNLHEDPDETRNLAALPEMKGVEDDLRLELFSHIMRTQIQERAPGGVMPLAN
jgi:choline-sulfatase